MHRKDLICEMKTILTKEILEIKQQYDQELDEMKGKIHVLEVENESLRHKVDKLWGEREAMIDNVNSAKTQAVNNAQYARRTNIIIYGVKEANDEEEDLKGNKRTTWHTHFSGFSPLLAERNWVCAIHMACSYPHSIK